MGYLSSGEHQTCRLYTFKKGVGYLIVTLTVGSSVNRGMRAMSVTVGQGTVPDSDQAPAGGGAGPGPGKPKAVRRNLTQ